MLQIERLIEDSDKNGYASFMLFIQQKAHNLPYVVAELEMKSFYSRC